LPERRQTVTGKTVEFKISKDGMKVDVNAEGFTGTGCKDFSKGILKGLGTVEEEKKKPDFFEKEHIHTTI
jgi:hypothetical protein